MSGRNRRALLRGVCEGGDLPGGAMVDLTGTKLETVDTAKEHTYSPPGTPLLGRWRFCNSSRALCWAVAQRV